MANKKVASFFIDKDLLKDFNMKAEREDKNRSAVVRRLMRQYIGGR